MGVEAWSHTLRVSHVSACETLCAPSHLVTGMVVTTAECAISDTLVSSLPSHFPFPWFLCHSLLSLPSSSLPLSLPPRESLQKGPTPAKLFCKKYPHWQTSPGILISKCQLIPTGDVSSRAQCFTNSDRHPDLEPSHPFQNPSFHFSGKQ